MTILITGATGNVGRHVVARLAEGGHAVRTLARRGADVTGDLLQPETLAGVFDGVERMMLFPIPYTAREVVGRAVQAGVRHIVVLSSSGVADGEGLGYDFHRPVEQAVEESGASWTHVRAGEFMTNRLDFWPDSIRRDSLVRDVGGDQATAPVHPADVADIIAAALTEDGRTKRIHVVHGPEALTKREQVRIIAEAIGRSVNYVELARAEARAIWAAQGMPEEVADYMLTPWEGSPETMSPEIKQILGHGGRTFAQWAAQEDWS
ncbi:NmrA family NAD(P)-binding protein [Nonomuraea sp. NPDC050556]|uniref:NAD(P)H-binding protein n=1 Tax=Nonomuraea sp. NPDC050556 TaxID=3364369 RepID=UPI003791CDC3